ncbi:PREDICTED: probable ubiquitin-conjugating enzyme E2 C isoform X2 [Ipomoea nil]|uniref:probable ubiquitin-conjugating enzyme E2 C isoform X2 n=1 Tax=Ipomoea nil TaxID=35883 RepID=UPI000900EFAC|nr:PREDICTED: probable ubiquitin-conjugating enzyme E2 C isoform X2 [Ipomoea nil]
MEPRGDRRTDNLSDDHRARERSSKQLKASPTPVDTVSVTQRLQKELMALMMTGGDLDVSAFPEGESIFTWIGTIEGGKGTMYEGLLYKLSLHFPLDYPFKPPQVKFETMCFHPNVDQYGNICLDILQNQTLKALLTALLLHFGRTKKSTERWCGSITWPEKHLIAKKSHFSTMLLETRNS